MAEKNRRYNIGLLIEVEGTVDIEGYKTTLRAGISEKAEELDVNIICFAGGALLRSPYNLNENQRNIVYRFVNSKNVDGLIIISTIGSYTKRKEFENFLLLYKDIPKVIVGENNKNYPSIMIDNKKGMEELVAHLLVEHKCKNIAFIKGPAGNLDAEKRFNVFKNKLKDFNIKYDQNMVVSGNFLVKSGREAIKKLIDIKKVKFDAIIASNDHMALGALEELNKRGISVPNDVFLVGFDNSIKARASIPPLTTVNQPVKELGRSSVDLIYKILNGEKTPKLTKLDSELIIRQSCGCFQNKENISIFKRIKFKKSNKEELLNKFLYGIKNNKNLDCLNVDEKKMKIFFKLFYDTVFYKSDKVKLFHSISDLVNYNNESSKNDDEITCLHDLILTVYELFIQYVNNDQQKQHLSDIYKDSIIHFKDILKNMEVLNNYKIQEKLEKLIDIIELLFSQLDVKFITDVIEDKLKMLDINSCFIALAYDNTKGSEKDLSLDSYEPLFACKKTGRLELIHDYSPIKEIIPSYLFDNNKCYNVIIKPLFFKDIHLGLIIFEQGIKEGLYYEMLRSQISNALYSALLYSKTKQAEEKLKEALRNSEFINEKLHNLSIMDSLTGLYNRRGFNQIVEDYIRIAENTNEYFLLFFIDLDDLKIINDKYGHAEGDNAIILTAEILKETFRQTDIISRIGGDEFTVIAKESKIGRFDILMERLNKILKEKNKELNKSYNISLSVGMSDYYPGCSESFENLIKSADEKLYENKLLKKKRNNN